MPEEISTAEVLQRLAVSLKSIKEELQLWHDESKRNQTAISALSKRLDMLSRKTTVPPSTQQELAAVKAKLEALSLQPVAGNIPGARQALEQKLAQLNQELEQIKAFQSRMQQLSASSESGDRRIEEQIRALKEEVDAIPRNTPSTAMAGKDFLVALQKDLEDWHRESMQNSKEITALLSKLQLLESKTTANESIKKDLERVMSQVAQVTKSINNFEELRETLAKHNEEFKGLYSTIGKEHVELDSLNGAITSLQAKLNEWSTRNKENLEEVADIRNDLSSVAKELNAKDVTKKVGSLSDSLHELADRVESLQRQEKELQDMQERLVEFDKGLKELVRKAVVASLSRKEFEAELSKLEATNQQNIASTTPVQPRVPTRPVQPRTPAKPVPVPDVKKKMRELRAALEEEKKEEGISDIFANFEKEINTADTDEQKEMLWNNLQHDIEYAIKDSLDKAKEKVKRGKAAGLDTSKLNILIAKTDIGFVSLETSVSLKNMAKAKEIVQKLANLKAQIDDSLKATAAN